MGDSGNEVGELVEIKGECASSEVEASVDAVDSSLRSVSA